RALSGGAFDVAVIPFQLCADVLLQVTPASVRANVLVSMTPDDLRTIRSFAWRHAVCGYLLRQDLTSVGLTGIFRRLLGGEFPVPSSCVRELLAGPRELPVPGVPGVDRLTEREHAVLAQLVKGLSNHQIARAMKISVHGVKRHVSNLLVKFDCSNRTEVALAAARLGMQSSV
ncbi:MAG: LuxR C-terminal-related transcriptional regulator, partial [Actinocatenispora sp.]